MLKGLKARSIGPAVMGGRVSDIALDPKDPFTFYVGFATSGVWKTANNGVTLEPIFDGQPVQSIGAVAVAPSDPQVVWAGTGEGNDRNSSGWGNGVYRSADGGGKWEHAGLKESRAIRRIAVHPANPDVAYVAAAGSLWAHGGVRGLYKTADGGKTWRRVLAAAEPHDAVTGCADVVLDPRSPDVLYAALYARQRKPWEFLYGANATGGADAGGIFKSTDGGAAWTKLEKGLPARTGRIGLAVSRSRPEVVMAVVQSDEGGTSDIDENHSRRGGIFRSEDSGATWKRVNALNPRAFYFSRLEIDPANDQRVYVLGWILYASDDGGRTFREDLYGKVHVDMHAIAIQPGSAGPEPPSASVREGLVPRPPVSRRIVAGNDGGIYQTFDAGKSWDFLNKVPAAQYYRIEVDGSTPYRIAGGLQDNTNWVGPSRTFSKEGIRNADWTQIGGGDGFYCVFDPGDPDVIYAESQGGVVHRFQLRTGEMRVLQPKPTEGQPAFRFHWCSPLIGSRHAKGTLYLAGNRVFKLTGGAEQFEVISPDLSRNEPDKTTAVGSAAETYAVVYALAESPLKAGLLFAGTDDGRLWATEDEGGRWTEITGTVPEEARGKWVARIEPSRFDASAAYVVFTAYRSGDDAPYVYRMAGLGREWVRVSGDLPAGNPAIVVREDPVNPSLLYLGTELGLFATLDGGKRWLKLGGLPAVRVDDLKVHPLEADLVVGTHGRGIYVLDDTRPLRELTPEVAAKEAHLFTIRPAHGRYLLPGWESESGKGWFKGENPPEGALLTVWIGELSGEKLTITIESPLGQTVAKLEAPAVPGLTRIPWDLRVGKDFRVDYGGDQADRFVPPGEYTAELSYKGTKVRQTFSVTVEKGIAVHGTYRR
ncbi:MAG: glycosyl hydrolase [Planctomycetes bacterium]|nr:glycosyl hydrolase [Planctomycetota bacterium]